VKITTRAGWQDPAVPVSGPESTPFEWQWNTLHWPGGNCGSDPPSVLRSMQASWMNSKGYSLGYNFAVWPDGSGWEIRGWDIRCAANGDQTVNRPGVAILLAVPNVDTAPTDAMIATVREIVGATRSMVSQTLIVNAHRDVRPEPTQCCGEVIVGMIAAGVFEPAGAPVELEGDEMIFRTTGTGDAIYAQGSNMDCRHVTSFEGAVAAAANPGWADGAPTLDLPADVTAWLASL
jgi:hypothetical protein